MIQKQIYSVTIFFKPNTKKPRKYRNVQNLKTFEYFAKKDIDAYYFNVYEKENSTFVKRIWLKDF